MREIALFGEDYAHELVIGALVERIAAECNIRVQLDWRHAFGGHGEVVAQSKGYLRDLSHQGGPWTDLIIAAPDANCKGLNERRKEMSVAGAPAPTLLAVPDPHIERWFLKRSLHGDPSPDAKKSFGRHVVSRVLDDRRGRDSGMGALSESSRP